MFNRIRCIHSLISRLILPLIEVRTIDSIDNYSREARKTTSRIIEEKVLDKYTKEYLAMC